MIQGQRAVRDLDHVGLSVGQPKLARSIGQPHRHLESLRLFDSGGSRLTRILRYTATSSCKPPSAQGVQDFNHQDWIYLILTLYFTR